MVSLSIIIPHYNSSASLKRLIYSIPELDEIQIIIVDDHSSDQHMNNILNLKKECSGRNIVFLNNFQDKKGAGACRNIGIDKAEGKWILFADADDYFKDGFFETVQIYLKSTNDVVFFRPTSEEMDTGNTSDRHIPFVEIIDGYLKNKGKISETQLRFRFVVPWSKLIKRDLIVEKDIYFDEVISANDVMFSTKLGFHMNKFECSNAVIYCVTKSKGSLTTTITQEVFDTRMTVFIDYYQYLQKQLSKEEFNILRLTGRGYIANSMHFGIQKIISVYLVLRRNRIRIIEKQLLNPVWLIKRIKLTFKKHRNEKRYIQT